MTSPTEVVPAAPVLLVHGGAGTVPEHELALRLQSLEEAAQAGRETLRGGGSALDAAVRAVMVLEDAPLLNAGYDCCLNLDGEAEFDASVMDSSGLCGGVGAVRGVCNPVLLARAVAERTEHRLLAGAGARRFARLLGLPMGDALTPRTEQRYGELMARYKTRGAPRERQPGDLAWRRLPELIALYSDPDKTGPVFLDPDDLVDDSGSPDSFHSTVGAVVLDAQGRLAAATSTGGIWLKLPGRVGDSAIPGAGTYCDRSGAASATGMGDGILVLGTSRKAVEGLAAGKSAEHAAREAIQQATDAQVDCGLLLLAPDGSLAVRHNCKHMPYAILRGDEARPQTGI